MHTRTSVLWPSGLCPGLPGWCSTRTDLDFTEARDSEWQWYQLGRMQICTFLQTDNHAIPLSPPPLSSLLAGGPSCCLSVKALKAYFKTDISWVIRKFYATANAIDCHTKNVHYLDYICLRLLPYLSYHMDVMVYLFLILTCKKLMFVGIIYIGKFLRWKCENQSDIFSFFW